MLTTLDCTETNKLKKMLNKIIYILLCCAVFSCTNSSEKKVGEIINENTEWSHTWIVKTNDTIFPKVLLVGDSHVERYYPKVVKKLGPKVSCSKFTTSKSLGDPIFLKQLESVLMVSDFDVISFNNGLHGPDYEIEAYASFLPLTYNLLKKNVRKSIIWVNSTAIREKNELDKFAPRNEQIIERNKVLSDFTKSNNITLVDFYLETANNSKLYSNDGVHFNNDGVNMEADLVTNEILKILDLNKY